MRVQNVMTAQTAMRTQMIMMLMQQQLVRHLVMALARILMMTLAFVLLARWYWCDTEPLKGMLSVAAWSEAHATSVKMFFSQKEGDGFVSF